uniref:Uncharacterized protein n=1 Tax=Strigamia maritima TaxID=126957 RepID=T1IPA5_STRMM
MAVNNLDVFMVKLMCSNVKMEFDLAKANFLEIQEAMETFHSYLKRMEQMEKQHPNHPLDGELANLKAAVNRAKNNMNTLRGKLAKNTSRAEEGYRLLSNRLFSVEERLDEVTSRKRKYEDLLEQYKRLRTPRSNDSQTHLAERQSKLLKLDTNIQDTDGLMKSTAREKQILSEACDKMQVFLDDTKGVLNHFKEATCARKKECINLFKWCSSILQVSDLHMIREHSISEKEIAFEYQNQPTVVVSCPRLVLTVTFNKRRRGAHPYSIISVKANIESLAISDLIDRSIENNQVLDLLTKVQLRWLDHIPLLNEIMQLRDKYAIDWLVEQQRLRFMVGQGGNIICTLVIPSTYPHKGAITLEQVSGFKLESELAHYKPSQDVSISGWLDYLSNLL